MRDFSKISPTVWGSRKFTSLTTDTARYLYLYLLSNSHCNSVGCYVLPDGYACADLKWSLEQYREAMDSLRKAYLIERDEPENTVLITNWEVFNVPTNQKHAIGAIAHLGQVPSPTLKLRAFQSLTAVIKEKGFDTDKGVSKAISMFFEAYGKPIATKTETEKETEKETRPRPDLEKTETRESSRNGECAASPDGAAHPPSEPEIPDLPDVLNRRLLGTPLMRRTNR